MTNADVVSTGSFIEIYGTGNYDHTLDSIKEFVDINKVTKFPDHINTRGVWTTG